MTVGIKNIKIGPHVISHDTPPIFLAEIGAFFGQDIILAAEMIGQIAAARNDFMSQPLLLKTEILHDYDICLRSNVMETYAAKDGRIRKENYRSLIERKVISFTQYARLFSLCQEYKLPYVASVYDFSGADFAVDVGSSALKIASSNIINLPLIRHCAGKGVPIILDTGRATIAEVYRGVEAARIAGCHDLVVEHSPDGHPAKPNAHNLRVLQTYIQNFNVPVGLSDHHTGLEMMYMSIALGASIIEKGVHVAPDELDIDISHTMAIEDLPLVLRKIYACWQAMGKNARDLLTPIDGVIGTSQRQCLVARKNLYPGDSISFESVRFAFPCLGISVENWDLIDGWKVSSAVMEGSPIQWRDICADEK